MLNKKMKRLMVTVTATAVAMCMMAGTALAGVSAAGCPTTKCGAFSGLSVKHVKGHSEIIKTTKSGKASVSASGKFDGKYKAQWDNEMIAMGYRYNVVMSVDQGEEFGYLDRNKASGTYKLYLEVVGTPLVAQESDDSQKLDWVGQDYSKRVVVY